jgi:small nuclear ribonucleoprotein (snRNP)-like protein
MYVQNKILKPGKTKTKFPVILGKKCKIFIKHDYIITGFIYSIDKLCNFLVYNSYISRINKKNNEPTYSYLRFIRGETINYIMILNQL